jgi:hypothetical protein
VLRLVGLEDKLESYPDELSGGVSEVISTHPVRRVNENAVELSVSCSTEPVPAIRVNDIVQLVGSFSSNFKGECDIDASLFFSFDYLPCVALGFRSRNLGVSSHFPLQYHRLTDNLARRRRIEARECLNASIFSSLLSVVLAVTELVEISKCLSSFLPTKIDTDDIFFKLRFVSFLGAEVAEVIDGYECRWNLCVSVTELCSLKIKHLDSAEPSFSGHEEDLVIIIAPDDDGMQEAIPLYAVSKVGQGLLVEVAALTVRADDDGRERDIAHGVPIW